MTNRLSGFTADELSRRSKVAADAVSEAGLDGLLILQDCDIYYFTSTAQSGALFISGNGEGVFYVIRDFERARAESRFPNIVPLRGLKLLPDALREGGFENLKRIGLEFDVLPVKNYLYLKKLFPKMEFADASSIIRKIRSVKSPVERELMVKAGEMHTEMFNALPSLFTPGAREIDIAAGIEAFFRKSGHQGIIRMRGFNQKLFYGVALSGTSGAVTSTLDGPVSGPGLSPSFPQGASAKVIGKNEAILVDMVSAYEGYVADGARTLYIESLPEKAREAHDCSLMVEKRIVSLARPGAVTGEIYEEAKRMADDSGFGENFMGLPGKNVPFVAHGIGLELDELPVISRGGKDILEVGNVIALEPKFVFDDIGAVGVENSYFIGPDGPELLTKAPISPIKVDIRVEP
ncbi:MAG: aminopeptidase P family protein [Deltaproteobacteria bacterium]|uniref:Aminopeptidase P family protein n=1 Tax=Candidatus Zymogenus saltonus TaxID=2844893 RepID=A0A9D8KEP3_9DELT|nr:aminopeptidase P family protein [Candidatus Zymogenus saltonus]